MVTIDLLKFIYLNNILWSEVLIEVKQEVTVKNLLKQVHDEQLKLELQPHEHDHEVMLASQLWRVYARIDQIGLIRAARVSIDFLVHARNRLKQSKAIDIFV